MLITVIVMCTFLIALAVGWQKPGVLLAGSLFTYQAGALASFDDLGQVYIVIAFGITLVRFLQNPRTIALGLSDYTLALLLCLLLASISWARYPTSAALSALKLMLSVGGIYAIARLQTIPIRQLTQQLIGGGLGLSILMNLCLLSERDTSIERSARLYLAGNESASAVGLSMALPFAMLIAAMAIFLSPKRWVVALGLFSILLTAYVSIISATRSVFLSFAFGFIIFVFLGLRRMRLSRLTTALFLGIVAVTAMISVVPESTVDNFHNRFLGSSQSNGVGADRSSAIRLVFWRAAERRFQESPFLGSGIGSFADLGLGSYPHNLFMEIATGAGIVGVILLIIWLGSVAFELWRGYRADAETGAFLLSFLAISIAQLQVSFAFFMAKPLFLMSALAPLAALCAQKNEYFRKRKSSACKCRNNYEIE